MTFQEIYRRAAERIVLYRGIVGENYCCCHALNIQSGRNYDDILTPFCYWFRPKDAKTYWWADPRETNADQEARRLALLFMAEICRTEGIE